MAIDYSPVSGGSSSDDDNPFTRPTGHTADVVVNSGGSSDLYGSGGSYDTGGSDTDSDPPASDDIYSTQGVMGPSIGESGGGGDTGGGIWGDITEAGDDVVGAVEDAGSGAWYVLTAPPEDTAGDTDYPDTARGLFQGVFQNLTPGGDSDAIADTVGEDISPSGVQSWIDGVIGDAQGAVDTGVAAGDDLLSGGIDFGEDIADQAGGAFEDTVESAQQTVNSAIQFGGDSFNWAAGGVADAVDTTTDIGEDFAGGFMDTVDWAGGGIGGAMDWATEGVDSLFSSTADTVETVWRFATPDIGGDDDKQDIWDITLGGAGEAWSEAAGGFEDLFSSTAEGFEGLFAAFREFIDAASGSDGPHDEGEEHPDGILGSLLGNPIMLVSVLAIGGVVAYQVI